MIYLRRMKDGCRNLKIAGVDADADMTMDIVITTVKMAAADC